MTIYNAPENLFVAGFHRFAVDEFLPRRGWRQRRTQLRSGRRHRFRRDRLSGAHQAAARRKVVLGLRRST
ncbi:hypothetical protein F2981_15955 [Sinorhizobium meliloti]|nr:hypothetical protein [Sinorhizobium meliloti]